MSFEIIGEIGNVKTIAIGKAIRDIKRIRKQFGPGRWRKLGERKIKLKAFID